jgi:hypothetical protein
MRLQVGKWVSSLAMLSLLVAGSGCGLKEYFNCRDICNKKKECGSNSNYDVSACVSSCSDQADNNADYARKVDTCKECVSGVSCADYGKMLACYVNCPALP